MSVIGSSAAAKLSLPCVPVSVASSVFACVHSQRHLLSRGAGGLPATRAALARRNTEGAQGSADLCSK